MAMNLQSPYLPTFDSPNYDSGRTDPFTTARTNELNAVIPYTPTVPPTFHDYIRYDGSGVGDENYNVGYHQQPVQSGIIDSWTAGRYEAPNIPVSHLPYSQGLNEATLVRYQSSNQPVYRNWRAPGINEE